MVECWPVMPLCKRQMRDVRKEDVLYNGLYRLCDIYRGGGGYDRFGVIFKKRFGFLPNPIQFVVQLKGCPLSCNYCYVTVDGVHGEAVNLSTKKLLTDYYDTRVDVFHLMGGAPALYLTKWKELSSKVKVFHSDFLLIEHLYDIESLKPLKGLFAISLKENRFYTKDHFDLMWRNLETIKKSKIEFYITFTGQCKIRSEVVKRFGELILEDSFSIEVVEYNALKSISRGLS